MDFCRIALRDIRLEDRTFEIRRYGSTERLHASLARSGMLDPPWIWNRDGVNLVVDGFKRIEWAGRNGLDGAVCRILPGELTLRQVWERRLEKKLFESDMDLAEKARIVSVLVDLFPPAEIPRPFLAALNISPRPGVLGSWAVLSEEEPEMLRVLAAGDIAERAALEVAVWDRESRAAVVAVLAALRCSASIQVEIIERVDEIAIREAKPRIEVLRSGSVTGVFSTKDANHRQKTKELREALYRMRFPKLAARERWFRDSLRSLALPPPVRLVPPPAFEGNGWKMELSFADVEELRSVFEIAGRFLAPGLLDRLFEQGASGNETEKR